MPTPLSINSIIDAYRSGHQTLLVSGRDLHDLEPDQSGGIQTLSALLTQKIRTEFGMASLHFNLALKPNWDWSGASEEEQRNYERSYSSANLPLETGLQSASDLIKPAYERAYHLLASLYRSIQIAEEFPPLMMLCEFGEDLAPDSRGGYASENVTLICEILRLIALEHERRKRPLLLILSGDPDHMDPRIVNAFHRIHLNQPDREEKSIFIAALKSNEQTSKATMADEVDEDSLANLTAKTPNKSLEAMFLASSMTGRPISTENIIEQKRSDVIELSEGTLSLLDSDRVKNIRLVGRTIERPLTLLQKWADGLKAGNKFTPTNIILAGAPSTAKTDLALLIAANSGTPAYSILSPKGSLVGETETKVRRLFQVFKELSPAFGMIDEITEAFPTERHSMNLDSGASASVTAEMLTALSDSSRAGKSLLIATTNCPWKVGAAMASRFLYLPVLSPVREDYADILCAVAHSLIPDMDWDSKSTIVQNAASVFYDKGASPRVMRTLISSKIATGNNSHSLELLTNAARACAPQNPRDRMSAVYADLFAIRACSDLEMLPWHGRITDYPLPDYLNKIVDSNTGEIDADQLDLKIEELKPHVNV